MNGKIDVIANTLKKDIVSKFIVGQKIKINCKKNKYHNKTGIVLGYLLLTDSYRIVALKMDYPDENLGDLSNIVNSAGISFKTTDKHGLLTVEENLISI